MADPRITADDVTEGLGAFDEIELLGAGTFGTTFRVARGDDEYALKVIHYPNMPPHLWDREIAALEAVEHPNVVAFREAGRFRVDGQEYPYIECEYIDGGTVAAAIAASKRPASEAEMREFLTGMLAGVAEIHQLGIIHRDIKPANVALRDADWGQPVLLDFGLSKMVDGTTYTSYPALQGTVPYMAPEQLRLDPARTRSDLFAVGAVAYEAGTGMHPFGWGVDAHSTQELHERIKSVPPPEPSGPPWAEDTARVVMRLLSFNGHQRLSVERALRDLEGGE